MSAALVASLIPTAANLVTSVLDKLAPDEKKQAEILLKQMEYEQEQLKGQLEVNTAEASRSTFVGGWRPFIGWVCGMALLYEYIVRPLGIWAVAVWNPGGPLLPSIAGDGMLWELMFGMLGLASLRTFEKAKRVTK